MEPMPISAIKAMFFIFELPVKARFDNQVYAVKQLLRSCGGLTRNYLLSNSSGYSEPPEKGLSGSGRNIRNASGISVQYVPEASRQSQLGQT